MSIKIVVDLITKNGKHSITLPQSQNMFDNHLNEMKIFTGDTTEYEIVGVYSGLDALDKCISFAEDIDELNFLAQLIDGFNEKEMQTYESFLSFCTYDITIQYLINVAYNFNGHDEESYDGRFFPDYDYENKYFMKIKLSLPDQDKGIYILLPANQSVINRALYKLGVESIEECNIQRCSSGNFKSVRQIIMQQ